MAIPPYFDLFNPVLEAIKRLGGSATVAELNEEVIKSLDCKRYQGSVGSGVIRDFRGAMVGRADRGLIITTGKFTREAKAEATRDGAPPIDLVDGEQLLDKLKELRLAMKNRSGHVILSAAKNLSLVFLIGCPLEILRCAQNDIPEGLFHGLA